jgi:hypothetical protein
MKTIVSLICLMFLAGCASVAPRTIEDVNVGDTLEYNLDDSEMNGCAMNVLTITKNMAPECGGALCGALTCTDVPEHNSDYVCFTFEAFRNKSPDTRERDRELFLRERSHDRF